MAVTKLRWFSDNNGGLFSSGYTTNGQLIPRWWITDFDNTPFRVHVPLCVWWNYTSLLRRKTRGVSKRHRLLKKEWMKEGNVLFNDTLNTFYLWLYGKKGSVLFNDTLNTFYLWLYGKKGSVLFNDALNTFYLRLYGKGLFR